MTSLSSHHRYYHFASRQSSASSALRADVDDSLWQIFDEPLEHGEYIQIYDKEESSYMDTGIEVNANVSLNDGEGDGSEVGRGDAR